MDRSIVRCLMRGIEHEWRRREDLHAGSVESLVCAAGFL